MQTIRYFALKRTIIFTIAVLILIGTTLAVTQERPDQEMIPQIDFFIGKDLPPPSFDPLNSDSLINALHVEQLLGTLVRLTASGRYESFLAKSWSAESGRKMWRFILHKNLSCEDGTPINASSYKHGLEISLKRFGKGQLIPLLENLDGYASYAAGTDASIKGILAKDELTIEFSFTTPVTSGFLEYLGLPFMAFFCPGNFNAKSEWADENHIVSSASYRLDKWDRKGPVHLVPRTDWPLNKNKPIPSVTIHRKEIDSSVKNTPFAIVLSFAQKDRAVLDKYQIVNQIPTILSAISLSADPSSPFYQKATRQKFKALIEKENEGNPWSSEQILKTSTFYSGTKKTTRPNNGHARTTNKSSKRHRTKVRVLIPSNPGEASKYMLTHIERSLHSLGMEAVHILNENPQKDLPNLLRNPKAWDIRIVNVDIGGGIENQLIKFMFCSNLGISFPDPNGRICALVSSYETKYGDDIPKKELTLYLDQFNDILDDDSAVIPFFKSGKTWLVSPSIDISFLSPAIVVPFFDLARQRK